MSHEGKIFVAVCLITLALHGNATLKGKRSVLNRVKSRVMNDYNVSISEVAAQDRLQTAVLGIAAIGSDRVYLEGLINKIVGFVGGISTATIADVQTSIEVAGGHAFV